MKARAQLSLVLSPKGRNVLVVQGGEGAHLLTSEIAAPWPHQVHSEASIYFKLKMRTVLGKVFKNVADLKRLV